MSFRDRLSRGVEEPRSRPEDLAGRDVYGDGVLLGLEDVTLVSAWTSRSGDGSGAGVFGQQLSSTGAKIDAEFRVNNHATGDQTHPRLAGLGETRFVVVWNSQDQDGAGEGVFGQIFNSAGVEEGDEFLVNTTVDGNQQRPDVAVLGPTGFVVAWEHDDGAAEGRAVMAQRFDADGRRIGNEFMANAVRTGVRPSWVRGDGPSICVFPDGHYLVAWGRMNLDAEGVGAFGRLFDTDDQPVADEFQLTAEAIEHSDNHAAFRYSVDLVCIDDGRFAVVWTSSEIDSDGLGVKLAVFSSVVER